MTNICVGLALEFVNYQYLNGMAATEWYGRIVNYVSLCEGITTLLQHSKGSHENSSHATSSYIEGSAAYVPKGGLAGLNSQLAARIFAKYVSTCILSILPFYQVFRIGLPSAFSGHGLPSTSTCKAQRCSAFRISMVG